MGSHSRAGIFPSAGSCSFPLGKKIEGVARLDDAVPAIAQRAARALPGRVSRKRPDASLRGCICATSARHAAVRLIAFNGCWTNRGRIAPEGLTQEPPGVVRRVTTRPQASRIPSPP